MDGQRGAGSAGERELLAGIALNGPWKGFIQEASNPKRRHYGWGYSLRGDVSPEAAENLKSGDKKHRVKNGTKVYLATWDPGQDEAASIFRVGYVDYIRRDGHFVYLALHLDDLVDLRVPIGRDQFLLRYVNPADVLPAALHSPSLAGQRRDDPLH